MKTLWQICAPPRALKAANTLTCSVNNEQTPYRMSCHMMACDMILAMTRWKQLAKRPEAFNPVSMELLMSISFLSLAQIGAESESGLVPSRTQCSMDSSKSWGIHTVTYSSGIKSLLFFVSEGTHLLQKAFCFYLKISP